MCNVVVFEQPCARLLLCDTYMYLALFSARPQILVDCLTAAVLC